MADLTSAKIERVLDECDRLTEAVFLRRHRFGSPRNYWVVSPRRAGNRRYPAKAVAAVALGWEDINGGYSKYDSACNVLERANYSIVDEHGRPYNDEVALEGAVSRLNDLAAGLGRTERERIIKARLGQDIFRRELLIRSGGECEVTGLSNTALLRASHIKPWANCRNDRERLDPQNGIMLSALWDAAFDNGLVTFKDDGYPVLSSAVDPASAALLHTGGAVPLWIEDRRAAYLAWHREHCFKP